MKRILCLDVGRVRIGVALSDPLGITAQPQEVIDRKKVHAFDRIKTLIDDHGVSQILVGQPLTLAGVSGQAATEVLSFVDALRKEIEIPVISWDERLTTAQAERSLIEGGVRRSDRKTRIDKVAAAILLQSYLDAGAP